MEKSVDLDVFRPPKVGRARMRAALIVAIAADVSQWCLGPFGWAGADQAIDVVAMILTMWLLGFHPLLLPTAFLEFLPVVDWLPTWTGCVLLVMAQRKKQQAAEEAPAPVIVNPPPMIAVQAQGIANDEARMTKE